MNTRLAHQENLILAMLTPFERREKYGEPILLSLDQVAYTLGISRTTLWRRIKDGDLDTVQIGSRKLVPSESLQDFLSRNTPASSPTVKPTRPRMRPNQRAEAEGDRSETGTNSEAQQATEELTTTSDARTDARIDRPAKKRVVRVQRRLLEEIRDHEEGDDE